MSIEFPRFTACAIVEMAEGSGSGQATTVGRQDKKPHIAAWTVGCFVSDFFYYQYGICRMYSKENPQYFRLPVSGLYP